MSLFPGVNASSNINNMHECYNLQYSTTDQLSYDKILTIYMDATSLQYSATDQLSYDKIWTIYIDATSLQYSTTNNLSYTS